MSKYYDHLPNSQQYPTIQVSQACNLVPFDSKYIKTKHTNKQTNILLIET